ncbi:MAG: glycosyltransferase [Gemmatimonadaceae bacterium]
MTTVYIACSARNAGRWIDAFIESLVAQEHRDWELWVRNDGSTDDTESRVNAWRDREPRVAHVIHGESAKGIAQGFADVLRRLPANAELVATADADDVWLPDRLSRGVALMHEVQGAPAAPTLVISDLRVVDAELRELAPSFWRSEDLDPSETSLRALVIENVAVNPTMLFNGALLAELREIPEGAAFADCWIALVAAATGRIAVINEPTVLYRQHGANDGGARLMSRFARFRAAWANRARVRIGLDRMSRQAGALVAQYGTRMSAGDRALAEGLATIATARGWRRKAAIARWRLVTRHGLLRNVGVLIRG